MVEAIETTGSDWFARPIEAIETLTPLRTKEKGSFLRRCPECCFGIPADSLGSAGIPQTYSSAFFSFFMGLVATAISMNTIATTAKTASSTNELK